MAAALTDSQIIECFHILLQTSLAQAKAEHLLDSDVLTSAEADLMISGPALCMYFAALRCTTDPPTVPLPRKDMTQPPVLLSSVNCSPTFAPMLRVWSGIVPRIKELSSEHQHDLARVICGLDPVAQPVNANLNRIAAELRSVAIEISQRRSFQERYQTDLQTAIDAGEPRGASGISKLRASFRPPPSYEEVSSPVSTPSPGSSPAHSQAPLPPTPSHLPPQDSQHLSAVPGSSVPRQSRSPSIKDITAIETIRETLYAALGDVIATTPSVGRLLKSDPPRAYFSSVALAVLSVSQTNVTSSGSVLGVMGKELTLRDCPAQLRPLMVELGTVARQCHTIAEEDDDAAIRLAAAGRTVPEPRLDRVKKMLERGVGYDEDDSEVEMSPSVQEGRRSIEGRAIQFTNRLNALALNLSRLPTFQERQEDVFKVLSGVS